MPIGAEGVAAAGTLMSGAGSLMKGIGAFVNDEEMEIPWETRDYYQMWKSRQRETAVTILNELRKQGYESRILWK